MKLFTNWKMPLFMPTAWACNFFCTYQLGPPTFSQTGRYYTYQLGERLNFKMLKFAGEFVLYFNYGLLDAIFQSLCYWDIGALVNDTKMLTVISTSIQLVCSASRKPWMFGKIHQAVLSTLQQRMLVGFLLPFHLILSLNVLQILYYHRYQYRCCCCYPHLYSLILMERICCRIFDYYFTNKCLIFDDPLIVLLPTIYLLFFI